MQDGDNAIEKQKDPGFAPPPELAASVLSKVDSKISVSFGQIRNFEVLNLAMAKVKKVNIAVTRPSVL